MTQFTLPILTSILDTDAYKLHMQQAVFHRYSSATVVAEFRCRDDDKMGEYASEIVQQIELMHQLALTEQEYNYLASLPFFKTDYLDWLRDYRYNPNLVQVSNQQGQLHIRISGLWLDVILWEVPLLAVISEIVHRDRSPELGEKQAIAHLKTKLAHFEHNTLETDLSDLRIMDFGTRRRFSAKVQSAVVQYLKEHFPYFNGTSNYHLAHTLGLQPRGTQAHEWFQAHQQLCPVLADSQKAALQVWLEEYPHDLGIALTDCISMDAFLRDFNLAFAEQYSGLRHDSGDAIEWGEKAIAHYQQLGIDPLSKTLVFSDSLNLDKVLKLYRHFHHRIKLAFGIGTNLTCDIPPVRSLNIVIKLIECNGRPVAKLSDSPGKTISQDLNFIEKLKKAFNVPI